MNTNIIKSLSIILFTSDISVLCSIISITMNFGIMKFVILGIGMLAFIVGVIYFIKSIDKCIHE